MPVPPLPRDGTVRADESVKGNRFCGATDHCNQNRLGPSHTVGRPPVCVVPLSTVAEGRYSFHPEGVGPLRRHQEVRRKRLVTRHPEPFYPARELGIGESSCLAYETRTLTATTNRFSTKCGGRPPRRTGRAGRRRDGVRSTTRCSCPYGGRPSSSCTTPG